MSDFKYAEASRELEAILKDLESDRLDVDEVVVKVARAAELITACRERITEARLKVHQVTAALVQSQE